MKKVIAAILAVTALVLYAGGTASAANWPHAKLNRMASEIAGKPVSVHCEGDAWVWDDFAYGQLGIPGEYLDGFTYTNEAIVYLAPHQCERLHIAIETGYHDAGLAYVTASLLTLAHEASHQRNPYGTEAQTECAAMPLVVPLAVKHLGVPQTIPVKRVKRVWKRVGERRVRVSKVVTVRVTNPELKRMSQWVKTWHSILPAEYKAAC
jgi:hypothetical protein